MDFDGRITIMEDGKTNKDGQFPSKTFFYGSNDEFSWVKLPFFVKSYAKKIVTVTILDPSPGASW
jgi:hypothetical protein